MGQSTRTFTIGFDVASYDETSFAQLVASRYGTDHHEKTAKIDSMQRLLPQIVEMYDEPFADGSAIPTYLVSELAHRHVKVVLSGDGGDEVFAGYNWYERWFSQQRCRSIPSLVRRKLLAPIGKSWRSRSFGSHAARFLADLDKEPLDLYASQMELFSPHEKRQIVDGEWSEGFSDYDDYWYYRQYWRPELDPITRLQYADLKTYLPDDILTKVDRAAMAVGLEVRPPFLDHPLIEQCFRIPGHIRFANDEKKHLLIAAMRGVLPNEIVVRKKKGFSVPFRDWMRGQQKWVEDYLVKDPVFLKPDALKRTDKYAMGQKLWAMLVLEYWARNKL